MPALVLLLALILPSAGADFEPPDRTDSAAAMIRHRWRWRTFTAEHGLPSMRVHQVVETPAGTAWVVTTGGVAWFDGYRWWDARTIGLEVAHPARLEPAGDDRIIVVHRGRAYLGNQHGFEELAPGLTTRSAALGPDGARWLVAAGPDDARPRLYRLDGEGGDAVPVEGPAGAPPDYLEHIRTTRAGRLWISGDDGLYRRDGDAWIGPVLGGRTPPSGSKMTVLENERGDGLAVISGTGLNAPAAWEWGPDGEPRGLEAFGPQVTVAAALRDDGEAILGFESPALWVREAGAWEHVLVRNEQRPVTSLCYRSNGDLWVGTRTGVCLLQRAGMTWSRWSDGDGDTVNRTNAILATTDGALWTGTSAGLLIRGPDGATRHVAQVGDVPLGVVTGLAEDDEGGVWVTSGASFPGAMRYHDGVWRHWGAADGLAAPLVHKVVRDGAGRLWFLGLGPSAVGTPPADPGAFAWDGQRFERWDVERGLVGNRVYDFIEGTDGARWFATKDGLSRWRDGAWTHWTQADGLRANRVFTIAEDGTGRVWLGHQSGSHGLGWIDEDDRVQYETDANDIAHGDVYHLVTDARGLVWVASDGGVFVVREGVPWWVGRDHGWRRGRILTLRPLDDVLLIGTATQGVVMRVLAPLIDRAPARISIGSVALMGDSALVRWGVHVHEDAWPQERQSRVRLDGRPWSTWSDATETIIDDVHEGSHEIVVESRDLFGRTPTVSARRRFEIPTPLHHRAIFVVPLAMATGVLVSVTGVLVVRRRRIARALRLKTSQLTVVTDAMTGFLASETWMLPSASLLDSALEHTGSSSGFIGVLDETGPLVILAERHMTWTGVRHRRASNGAIVIEAPETIFGPSMDAGPGNRGLESVQPVPIYRGPDVVGLIGIGRAVGEPLSPIERDWIETLCRAAGLLYDSYRRRQWEVELSAERAQAERALRLSEARFRGLVESTNDWVWEVDADGLYTYCSPQVERLLGYLPAEMLGRHVRDFVDPTEADEVRARVKRVFRARRPFTGLKNTKRHRDGQAVIFESSGVPFHSADGKFRGYRGIARDVTERARSEAELRRRSELERLLFRELDHRVRNHLASMLSLVDLTRASGTDVDRFAASIRGRIEVMARVHTLLSGGRWRSVGLSALVHMLVPPGAPGSIRAEGDEVLVPPRQVTALAMLVHELMTNSVKHGALGVAGGYVHLAWSQAGNELRWSWSETGGPRVAPDPIAGVGTGLIEGLVRSELQGTASLRFEPDGVRHAFVLRFDGAAADGATGRPVVPAEVVPGA